MKRKIDGQAKFAIDDFDSISCKLVELEATFIGGSIEKSTRYDTDDDAYLKKGLFIRTKNGLKNIITLKEKSDDLNNDVFSRYITEIEIENVEDMEYILCKLGLTKTMIMEKYRMHWILKDINVFIDELPFGVFLEVKGTDSEINKIHKLLDLKSKRIDATYWDIYDKIKNSNDENIIFKKEHIFKIATYI